VSCAAAMPVLSLVQPLALATSLAIEKVLTVERSYRPKLVMSLELRGTPSYIEPDDVEEPNAARKKKLNSVDLNR